MCRSQCKCKSNMGKVIVVMDSQAGSCGKGKIIGYLASELNGHDIPMVGINNFMTNAGHTFVTDDGKQIMTQHLPTSMINPRATLCIGPGSALSLDVLSYEIGKYGHILGDRMIYIHPRAMVIMDKHIDHEKQVLRSGSTFKGCGAAQADKIMRHPDVRLFGECANKLLPKSVLERIQIVDTGIIVNDAINEGKTVIVEGSQGFDLDINYGLDYPNVTSRQCHAGQLLADCGISPTLVSGIIMVMRPYPIRISNNTNIGIDCYSGDYAGSAELSWDEIKRRCGAPDNAEFGEMTTVTKKLRRVFELNWDRLNYAVKINRPTAIALNFAQYIDYDMVGATEVTKKVSNFIEEVEYRTGTPVSLVGTGARNNEIIDYGIMSLLNYGR